MFFDEIRLGDKDPVQHLIFVVHGIGEACDAKFRSLVECVEDLREASRTILQSHYKSYLENGDIHRVVCIVFIIIILLKGNFVLVHSFLSKF